MSGRISCFYFVGCQDATGLTKSFVRQVTNLLLPVGQSRPGKSAPSMVLKLDNRFLPVASNLKGGITTGERFQFGIAQTQEVALLWQPLLRKSISNFILQTTMIFRTSHYLFHYKFMYLVSNPNKIQSTFPTTYINALYRCSVGIDVNLSTINVHNGYSLYFVITFYMQLTV